MSNPEMMFLSIVISVCVFLLLREVFCWYFKINQRAKVMKEINQRTGLVTVSLGSGPDADIMFLFSSDICGESERLPRHARAYGDIKSLRQQIVAERKTALVAYRADVAAKDFPGSAENASIGADELAQLIERLGQSK